MKPARPNHRKRSPLERAAQAGFPRWVLPGLFALGMGRPVTPVRAAAAEPEAWTVSALKRLSLEELANMEVTSVSKRAEPLSMTPAALHVLTGEDVVRSGVTTIPEALRWVPGLQVARIDSHTWAVGSRGFNDVFANKLLVLIDGRSVYTPLYSGVYWQYQDVLFEDLERIEVIRGPGATVWGANAVNGVINISTKPAAETQGILLSAGGGNLEPALFSARYGGRISDTAAYRVYGKFSNHEDFRLLNGQDAEDEWRHGQGGFRVDWDPSDESSFTLQGDGYANRSSQYFDQIEDTPALAITRILDRSDAVGGNLLGRWTRQTGADSELKLQAYYDRFRQEASYFDYDIEIVDVDAQHRFALGSWNEVVWGAGYRHIADDMAGSFDLSLAPSERRVDLANVFVQDEWKILDDRLSLFLGTKAEHNDYTGFEIQPGARVAWRPADRHSVWASVARAVRTPSRAEVDVLKPLPSPATPPGMLLRAEGSDDFVSEELLAYEVGYRVQPIPALSIDVAAFYNDYDSLRTLEQGAPLATSLPKYLVVPIRAGNLLEGRGLGWEAAVGWQVMEGWRVRTGYSFLDVDLKLKPGSTDVSALAAEGAGPAHQWFLISQWDLPHGVSVDAMFRYVDRLESQNVGSYSALDLRVAWQPAPNWEISVVGQNLVDTRHQEFGGSGLNGSVAAEVPRTIVGRVTWRY